MHEEIQEEVQRKGNGKDTGIYACMWERILEKWQKHIRDVSYEEVQVVYVKWKGAGAPHDREIPFRIEIPRNRSRNSRKMPKSKLECRD